MEDKIILLTFVMVWLGTTLYCFRKEMTTITSIGAGFLASLLGVVVISALFGQIEINKDAKENQFKEKHVNTTTPGEKDKHVKVEEIKVSPIPYKVMEVRDTSYANHRRVVYNIYLETQQTPEKDRMEATAKDVWNKNRRGWDEFTVFMIFGKITDFSAGAYGIANFDKRGQIKFNISTAPLQILELGEEFSETVDIKPQPPSWELEDNSRKASIMLTDLVKERLVSPSTAEFPGMFARTEHVRRIGPGKYSVKSWVDSQNRFGAMVRTNYYAEIQQTGPELHTGHWEMTSFETR